MLLAPMHPKGQPCKKNLQEVYTKLPPPQWILPTVEHAVLKTHTTAWKSSAFVKG